MYNAILFSSIFRIITIFLGHRCYIIVENERQLYLLINKWVNYVYGHKDKLICYFRRLQGTFIQLDHRTPS